MDITIDMQLWKRKFLDLASAKGFNEKKFGEPKVHVGFLRQYESLDDHIRTRPLPQLS